MPHRDALTARGLADVGGVHLYLVVAKVCEQRRCRFIERQVVKRHPCGRDDVDFAGAVSRQGIGWTDPGMILDLSVIDAYIVFDRGMCRVR